ncbi:MAG: flavodoxin family protein [Armatimonadota bacterium]
MKIACVLGSPRTGGNSETIARKIVEASGGEAQFFALNKLTFKGCQGCMGCKTRAEECVVKDDLSEVLRAVREADALILTSPIYYWTVSGQAKCFVDRTFSFLKPDYMTNPKPGRLGPGKKAVLVFTQGDPNPESFDLSKEYTRFMTMDGYESCQVIRGLGLMEKTDAANSPELMAQAEEIGWSLAG